MTTPTPDWLDAARQKAAGLAAEAAAASGALQGVERHINELILRSREQDARLRELNASRARYSQAPADLLESIEGARDALASTVATLEEARRQQARLQAEAGPRMDISHRAKAVLETLEG